MILNCDIIMGKLIHFLRRVVSYIIVVHLKDGSVITGRCSSVDSLMNVNLRGAKIVKVDGQEGSVEGYVVRGNNILYIELPPEVNLDLL